MGPQRYSLPGRRWRFLHGPIDIVIGAEGEESVLQAAHAAAWQRFVTLLEELVSELPELRQPVGEFCPVRGAVARRMWSACHPYRASFITPMAAVAGAVARELIDCYGIPGVERAWVNNGGDIALHFTPGASFRIGMFADLARFDPALATGAVNYDASFSVDYRLPVRGVATSGWRGRSFSLGIADSVTILARDAAQADAAATVVANAVNIDSNRIVRRPACELKDDSDLQDIPVTVDVPPLETWEIWQALQAGQRCAQELQDAKLIWAAALVCQGWFLDDRQALPRRLPGFPITLPAR